jgi:LacI family transcriptional regulator
MKPRAVTIHDVAREAGVSTASVSRVVNGGRPVQEDTARSVRAAIDKLGYKANQVARSLKTRATKTIGVVAPLLASDFFMLLAEIMDRELSAKGYSLIVCSSSESAEEEAKRLRLLAGRLVDGIIMIPASDASPHVKEIQARGIPVVFIDRMAKGVEADAVLVDNEGGARAATEALIADGYKRIGFLGADLGIMTARERYSGYRQAMAAAGLEVEERYTSFGKLNHIDSGFRSMEEVLALPGAPDAYFVVNADTHIGATNYLMTSGRAYRDRVVFASFDEMPFSPLLQFCRYSVSQPIAEMGRLAAAMMLGRIERGLSGKAEIVRLATTLIRH